MSHPVYERDLVNTAINLPIYGRKLFTVNFTYLKNVDELSLMPVKINSSWSLCDSVLTNLIQYFLDMLLFYAQLSHRWSFIISH